MQEVPGARHGVKPRAGDRGGICREVVSGRDAIGFPRDKQSRLADAVEALGNGEVSDITTSTIRDGAHVRIGITDTGPGLDPAIAPRLFQAFTSSKQDGMGLGLSVTRSIVESHGSALVVSRPQDGGACFTFRLSRPTESEAP